MAVERKRPCLPADLPETPDGWSYVPLADLVDQSRGISYGIVQPGAETDGGVPIIRVNNVKGGRIDTADVMRVAESVEGKYERTRLRGGEVLMSLVGTLGEVAVAPPDLRGWNVARAIGVLPTRDASDARWISLCVRSPLLRHCIRMWATTTVQATLNLRDVARLPIPMPPARERVAIASILGSLDDKIELNRRMNETLEGIARALFNSWFVDFDPVRAKAAGRQPVNMDAETARLFPSRFVDSPVGDLPEGWTLSTVGALFELTMGQSPPGESYNESGEGLPFFQGRSDFGFRFPSRRVYCTAPTRLARAGDVLVSVRAPVGDVNVALEDCAIGRGVAAVRSASDQRSFAIHSMKSLRAKFDVFESDGTVFGSVGRSDFERMSFVGANAQVAARFDSMVRPLDDRVALNEQESRTLASLRDALLPRLLSGEVRVRDLEIPA